MNKQLEVVGARLDVVDIYVEHGLVADARAEIGRIRLDLSLLPNSIGWGV